MPQTQTGPCVDCGNEVTRYLHGDPRFAAILEGIPLRCQSCDRAAAAEWDAENAERDAKSDAERKAQRLAAAEVPALLAAVDLDELDPAGCAGRHRLRPLLGTPRRRANAHRAVRHRQDHHRRRRAPAPARPRARPVAVRAADDGPPRLRARQPTNALRCSPRSPARTALVLDDLDKTRPTEYGAEQIFLAVDGAVTSGGRCW
jgi:hypothetical protein